MATNYCKNCGAGFPPENKFCENCGQPVDAAPTGSYEIGSNPMLTALRNPVRDAAFRLGNAGGVLGLILVGGLLGLGLLSLALVVEIPLEIWLPYFGMVVAFTIIGMSGSYRIINKRDTINAGLMILAGVGMLIPASLLGIASASLSDIGGILLFFIGGGFSAVLFFIGGVLMYLKKG